MQVHLNNRFKYEQHVGRYYSYDLTFLILAVLNFNIEW